MADNDKDYTQEGEPTAGPAASGGQEAPEEQEIGKELAEVKNRLAYLAAEFENYKKRVVRERESLVAFGNERLLLALLPTIDNLERAMAQGANGSREALLEGVRMTYDQFLSELKKFGVEQVPAEGSMFDPNVHEAIAQVPWEGKPEGTVVQEARKGYLLNGRLLRPAQVTVTRGGASASPESGDGGATGRERS